MKVDDLAGIQPGATLHLRTTRGSTPVRLVGVEGAAVLVTSDVYESIRSGGVTRHHPAELSVEPAGAEWLGNNEGAL